MIGDVAINELKTPGTGAVRKLVRTGEEKPPTSVGAT
jgi:hypothetical protein